VNWFSKKAAEDKPSFSYNEGVIIAIRLGDSDESSQGKEFDAIQSLESEIAKILPADSGVDGDDFGDGECTIYVYGPSADGIWGVVEDVLRRSMFSHIDITLQYGEPGGKDTKTRSFTL